VAVENFRIAVDTAAVLPAFDESARLTFQQRLGFCYIRLGDGVRAEQIFHQLILAFTQISGPENPNVLRVRLNLSQAYMIQNKNVEAVKEANAIYPAFVAALGPDHELTMQLLTTRAQSEGSLEMWSAAIRDDMSIYDLAVKKQGPLSFFAIATLSDASLAMCRSGRLADGAADSKRAFDASSKAFGPRAGLTGGVASTLATCLIDMGQIDDAAKLLDNIDIPTVTQLAGDPDWGAGVKLQQAKIAFARGNYELTRSLLREVGPVFTRPKTEAYSRREYRALSDKLERVPNR
jgi:tetratricopeptide (TPR) repeat protein